MAVPPPPGTRSNSRVIGLVIALAFGGLMLLFLCAGVVGGTGWWWNRQAEDPASTLTMEDVTVADGLPVEDDPVIGEPATEPEATTEEEIADSSYRPDWWSPDYWPGGSTEPAVDEIAKTDPVEPSESSTPPTTPVTTPPVYVGFTADGTSFVAPNEAGIEVATIAVMLGDVADSARSAGGRTEIYWVQGTQMDPDGGARVDRDWKVVNPDDIRRVVGISKVWTAIPGHVDVFAKCIPVHATDYEVSGSCLSTHTASR